MKSLLITSMVDGDQVFNFVYPICITEETGFVFSHGHFYFVDMRESEKEDGDKDKHRITDEEADKLAQSLLKRRGGSSRILPS